MDVITYEMIFDEFVKENFKKDLNKKVKRDLIKYCEVLNISISTNLTKEEIIKKIIVSKELSKDFIIKHKFVCVKIKDVIKYDISIEEIQDIMLKFVDFEKEINNRYEKLFFTDTIKLSLKYSKNMKRATYKEKTDDKKCQGLYCLCVDKYIVKIGSFAETQGIYGRIDSFGGGNYETGSATNKWFQAFIVKCLEMKKTVTFEVHYHNVNEIRENILGTVKSYKPYIMRKWEAELFNIYETMNNGISPIFGSNRTKD